MKIGIYTCAYEEDNISKARLTNKFKSAYCAIHGYDYIYIEAEKCNETRPTWKKVEHAIKLLPQYDLLMWNDADAAPVDFSRKIEDFTKDGFDFFIGKDTVSLDGRKEYFNAGVFIMRNTKWVNEMLEEWWRRSFGVDRRRPLQDQPELNHIYKENWNHSKQHIFIWDLQKREFQSVKSHAYQRGIFVKHCAASSLNVFPRRFWERLDENEYGKHGIEKKQ